MQVENKNDLVYIYILGQGNIYNGKNEAVSSLVPYKINDKKLFYGPCKKKIREEIKENYLKEKVYINNVNSNENIYIVGINPNLSGKDDVRKILFIGKIKEIFTFKNAWNKYNKLVKNNESINKMINGSKEEFYGYGHKREKVKENSGNKNFKSPLHLIPIKRGNIEGYAHRTSMHKYNWINDILSDKELVRYKTEKNISGNVEDFLKQNKINKIFKTKDIKFQRDCCFSLENISFSDKKKPNPIPWDEDFLNLIKMGLKNPKNADLKSPFGYDKNEHKYGRGHVKLVGEKATKFINILYEKTNKKQN